MSKRQDEVGAQQRMIKLASPTLLNCQFSLLSNTLFGNGTPTPLCFPENTRLHKQCGGFHTWIG